MIGLGSGISAGASPTRGGLGVGLVGTPQEAGLAMGTCLGWSNGVDDASVAVANATMALAMCEFWVDAGGSGDCSEQEAALGDAEAELAYMENGLRNCQLMFVGRDFP